MCKFIKRFLILIAIISMITAGIYFILCYFKLIPTGEQDFPKDMQDKQYRPKPAKRHYTQLNR